MRARGLVRVVLTAAGLATVGCVADFRAGARTADGVDRVTDRRQDALGAAARAFELRMAGNVDQAGRVLEDALAANKDDATLWFESARLCFYNCEFDRAWESVSKAIALDGENARYHLWAGQIATFNAVYKSHNPLGALAVAGEMAKSRRAYERAVELKPDFHQARLDLINLCMQQPIKDQLKARKHVEELKRLDPVFGARGQCMLLGRNAVDEQIALWKAVVAAHGERADAHAGLGQAYRLARKHREALEEFSKALDLDPSRSQLLFDIAYCHQATGETDSRARCYQRILDLDPPAPLPQRLRAMRYLATAEKDRGNSARAASLRDQADKMDPRFGKRGAIRDDIPDLYTAP